MARDNGRTVRAWNRRIPCRTCSSAERPPLLARFRLVRRWTMATTMTDYRAEREAMVERQLKRRGISESVILDAFREVPREEFIGAEHAHLAYGDHPLPIEAGQTISQPYIVALMIEAAGIKAGDKVLEVGAGSGYAAAVISRIARQVIAIERQHDLVEIARSRIARLGYD